MTSIFIDTNVLAYAYGPGEPRKRSIARELLKAVQPLRVAGISTQVLGEFFRVMTGRLQPPMPLAGAVELLELLAQSFLVWSVDELIVREAARGVRDHRLAYWDAQVWATARLRAARWVLSEDFVDGQTLEGVTFLNPFLQQFDVSRLLAG